MKHYNTTKGFCPHLISTKIGSVNLYRYTHDIDFVCRRYYISKASLMRWNKSFDGTRESLLPKSHRPHTPHPNAHTEEEIKWIRDYCRRTPSISICELYGKLREDKGYSRNPGSLYRVLVRLGYCCICMHINTETGVALPSRRTIAKECGIGKTETVDRAIAVLCEKGLIEKHHQYSEDGGYKYNIYTLSSQ